MPDSFTTTNIVHLIVGVLIIAVSVFYALNGILLLRKKRAKAIEVILFCVNMLVLALFMVFLIMQSFTVIKQLPFGVDEDFAITYGGSVIVIPVISELLYAAIKYPLFSVISALAVACSQFCAIVQIVKWKTLKEGESQKKAEGLAEQTAPKAQSEDYVYDIGDEDIDQMLIKPQPARVGGQTEDDSDLAALENQIIDGFNASGKKPDQDYEDECLELIRPNEILVGKSKISRTRTLRGKTYVKGDASLAYRQYLADKKSQSGGEENNAQ